jgi:putative DNA primase/helicase
MIKTKKTMKNIMSDNNGSNEQTSNSNLTHLDATALRARATAALPLTSRHRARCTNDSSSSSSSFSSSNNDDATLPPSPSLASFPSVENPPTICVNQCPSVVENSATRLLTDLSALICRFVILPPHAAEALGLWILHTYGLDLRDTTAYLGIESLHKGCGKTTLLSVLHDLACNAVSASNISPAALFRVIEQVRPTLLIDEADTFLPGNDQLRGILNAGYKKKTAYVWRVSTEASSSDMDSSLPSLASLASVKSGSDNSANPCESMVEFPSPQARTNLNSKIKNLKCFSTWCPKAIAQIGRLPDTLADRCILIHMTKKPGSQRCERLKALETAAPAIREACARFISEHRTQIEQAEPAVPTELSDRAAEIWEPLLVLADIAGGDWPKLAREAAIALSSPVHRVDPIAVLITDIQSIFSRLQQERLLTRTIVVELKKLADRPWLELANGKSLDDRWLAKHLRTQGVEARSVRTERTIGRGYVAADFARSADADVVHVTPA